MSERYADPDAARERDESAEIEARLIREEERREKLDRLTAWIRQATPEDVGKLVRRAMFEGRETPVVICLLRATETGGRRGDR